VYEEGRDRIGSALRRMAEDLVRERRQVLELRRENRRLRDELERLRAAQGQPERQPSSASGRDA
jgi:hypothetical protein